MQLLGRRRDGGGAPGANQNVSLRLKRSSTAYLSVTYVFVQDGAHEGEDHRIRKRRSRVAAGS